MNTVQFLDKITHKNRHVDHPVRSPQWKPRDRVLMSDNVRVVNSFFSNQQSGAYLLHVESSQLLIIILQGFL